MGALQQTSELSYQRRNVQVYYRRTLPTATVATIKMIAPTNMIDGWSSSVLQDNNRTTGLASEPKSTEGDREKGGAKEQKSAPER